MRTVDEGLTLIERELIRRGWRILYRRPDDDVITYQMQRGDVQWGFRVSEGFVADFWTTPEKLVDYLERSRIPLAERDGGTG